MNIPIVVVAYNREKSLQRLLYSLKQAHYDENKVDLIICIDKSENELVYEVAANFEWPFGEKKVLQQHQNLGLKEHVLKCGDHAFEAEAIIMLEDDLVVSKSFYRYAMQSVNYYIEDDNIAGISLYSYRLSESVNRPFIPLQDDCDVYFMQVPSSWGQIWTKRQWAQFREWYDKKQIQEVEFKNRVPSNVHAWPKTSWKKFFYYYIIEMNKYIVYPRVGLSTNMGEIGTHFKVPYRDYQAILMGEFNRDYLFKNVKDSIAVYDAFFENEPIAKEFNYDDPIIVDYYGKKTSKSRYIITTKRLDYRVVASWSLSLTPYELNIYYNVAGDELFLYDLTQPKKNTNIKKSTNMFNYDYPGLSKERAIYIAYNVYKNAIKRKLYKLFYRTS